MSKKSTESNSQLRNKDEYKEIMQIIQKMHPEVDLKRTLGYK